MAKRKPLQKSDPVGTLESQLNQDFNRLIREIHGSLSTKNIALFGQVFLLLVGRFKQWV